MKSNSGKATTSFIIRKANGEEAIFSEEKLKQSLEKAGADPVAINAVLQKVNSVLYDGISTKKIYQQAYRILKQHSRLNAGRYNIKKAIMDLGPSGFPFERFVSEILLNQGYSTSINQLLKGRCVTHEVDVLALKDMRRCMIECKYHNVHGGHCDVKNPLYIHSRFQDIQAHWLSTEKNKVANEAWLVTNTRFSTDAIRYGECIGLKLIGWSYPLKGSLQHWIENSGLYPITCLTLLSKAEKQNILESGIVLCRDMINRQDLLIEMGISDERIARIMDESTRMSEFRLKNHSAASQFHYA